jgi:hypothetical protein
MVSFERLIREHRGISARAADLRRAVAGPADARLGMEALERLIEDLAGHLATEDCDIYPALVLSRDAGTAAMAREVIDEFRTLETDWNAYVARWDGDAIAADWQGFASDTRTVLDRLDQRVRTENELLYPMALRSACITLRDAPRPTAGVGR